MDERDDISMGRRGFLGLAAAGVGLLSALPAAASSRAELLVRSSRPLDLETPVERFASYLTPANAFFVRSHHGAPDLDLQAWRLHVDGLVGKPLTLTLKELRQLPAHEVTAVLQCSGNGRAFYSPKVPGVPWERGAVGNAVWRGVRLADVLAMAGVDARGKHLALRGHDAPVLPATPRFTRSVPMERALHPDTLLAYQMNGQPLAPLHGAPLRMVVPGWVGDDWIKWLDRLTVQEHEADSFWVQTAYRYPLQPGKPGEAVPPSASAPMTTMVVKSLIATPANGARLKGTVLVQGVAWTGGDARISRVELSTDGGASWAEAELFGPDRPYAWRQWRFAWKAPAPGTHALLARATDSTGATQPLGTSPWNPSGYLWNAADGIAVTIV